MMQIGFDSILRVCESRCIIYHGSGRLAQQVHRPWRSDTYMCIYSSFLLFSFLILLCLGLKRLVIKNKTVRFYTAFRVKKTRRLSGVLLSFFAATNPFFRWGVPFHGT